MNPGIAVVNSPADRLAWSPWVPLRDSWRGGIIPAHPGLYRIRRIGRDDFDYIGQTGSGGMDLRRRLGMLRGIYADEMPYRDPHTAGPALWAIRHQGGDEFEVSVATVEGTTPHRKGLECLAIALYRQEFGRSPTFNFGRMPVGYLPSSANNARLVTAGRRLRGGMSSEASPNHEPGLPPVGPLSGDAHGPDWCGHRWSAWLPVGNMRLSRSVEGSGLYRIRKPGDLPGLVYLGEGKIRDRLSAHLAKGSTEGHAQQPSFAGGIEASSVTGPWLPHQRLELETDLIAAHVLTVGECPEAQFLG